MKTMTDWNNSNAQSFTEYCKVEEEVAEEIVDYFRNILPPASMEANYLQVGEVHSHIMDLRTEKERAAYITFTREDGRWFYKGICFRNETKHRAE